MSQEQTRISHENKSRQELIKELDEIKAQFSAKEQMCRELQKAVERYERQVHLFEGVASTTPDFVYLFDLNGRFLYANSRLLEVWGMKLPDVIGKTCRELGYEQWHHDMHMREIAQVIETKCSIKGEVPFEAPLTRLFGVYEYIFTPVISPDGEVELIAGTTRDVTERKRTEEALNELNDTLEQRVAERTAMAEARAKQLQSLAVELIEAEERERQQFAHLLHDDLQQMLAAANMQLQIVSDKFPHDPAIAGVRHILMETIAKARRLSHELSPPVLHHAGIVAALKWLGRQMGEQFSLVVEFETNFEPQLESIPLKTFLFRAVQELLFNIVKHAGVTDARIVLSGSDTNLIIAVSDNGRGFNADILNDPINKTGFGLITIRERASYVGGTLTIDSEPGKGSSFTLTVPLSIMKDKESLQQPPVVNPEN
jgi:PAS domain S-box-containing protein